MANNTAFSWPAFDLIAFECMTYEDEYIQAETWTTSTKQAEIWTEATRQAETWTVST